MCRWKAWLLLVPTGTLILSNVFPFQSGGCPPSSCLLSCVFANTFWGHDVALPQVTLPCFNIRRLEALDVPSRTFGMAAPAPFYRGLITSYNSLCWRNIIQMLLVFLYSSLLITRLASPMVTMTTALGP